MIRRFIPLLTAVFLLTTLIGITLLASGQANGVVAEAIIQANLRAAGDITTDVVGEIMAGTRYPVIGRNQFAVSTWYLLADPVTSQPIGWVYFELVNVTGDINSVAFSTLNVTSPPTPTPTPTLAATLVATDAQTPLATASGEATAPPTFTPTPEFSVLGLVSGEVNVRYGPGPNFDRLGVVQAGNQLRIVGYHTQFPWVQIAFDGAPEGVGWIAENLLEIQGDKFSTRAITRTDFTTQPTLTPTPAVIQSDSVNASFAALGNALWNTVLQGGFDPATSRFGALYLRDLRTGEELTFGNEFAFSGTSINKVAILVELFDILNGDPPPQVAIDIANTMICSENGATNRLLEVIGGGDDYAGAENVSQLLTQLGLQRTFLTAPYEIPGATPEPPSRPIRYPDTDADQAKANPNLTNQMTVDELGTLLASVYECAVNESGSLLTSPSNYTPQECRKMLHVMANNNVDALLKAGVPASVPVAHKHGWINDTHGNAAIFFTPGGDYVIVMMLFQPEWLQYAESLPVVAEVSRMVYNYYNPTAPQDVVREGSIPPTEDCNFAGSPLVTDLMSPLYGATLTAPFDPLTLEN